MGADHTLVNAKPEQVLCINIDDYYGKTLHTIRIPLSELTAKGERYKFDFDW